MKQLASNWKDHSFRVGSRTGFRLGDMIAFWTVAAFWVLTCIAAPAGSYLWLQHVPTFAAMPLLWWLIRRKKIDRASLTACLTFVALHCVGARWIYSYVPYDEGLQRLLGTDTHELLGWTRNHYDRLVHFTYGVCFGVVAWQWHRRDGRSLLSASWLAIEFVLATSALYEVAEWLVAILMAPNWAESYLGQQGDTWDAIKDMALAGLGAVLVALTLAAHESRQAVSEPPKTTGSPIPATSSAKS